MIKKCLLVFICAAALLGAGVAQAQAFKNNYRPIVGSNGVSSGFKTIQTPTSLQSANLGTSYAVKRIDYEVFGDTSGRMKFFLPPGTVAFNANLYYYHVFQEGKVVLSFNQIPSTPLGNIWMGNSGGPVNEAVLRSLVNGQEVLYYSEGAPANSLVLSSPENPIEPIAVGGYVYGDYQYPGGILQGGFLQIYVKADCYEQWFNSAHTQWDGLGNPDENATHTCEGSSGGGPADPADPILPQLQSVSTSLPTLQAGTSSTTLTLLPSPANAVLPTCVAQEPKYVVASGNQVSLLPAANTLTASAEQTIVCGSKTVKFTILPPAPSGGYTLWTEGEPLTFTSSYCGKAGRVENSQYLNEPYYDGGLKKWVVSLKSPNEVADGAEQKIKCDGIGDINIVIKVGSGPAIGGNAVKIESPRISQDGLLEFKLTRPEGNYSGSTTTWIAARIPALGGGFEYWFFLTPDGWQLPILNNPTLDAVAYGIHATRKSVEFSAALGVTLQDLQAYGVEIHFGYLDQEGVFQYKGIIWPR